MKRRKKNKKVLGLREKFMLAIASSLNQTNHNLL
jgi:hypothetical protein